MPKNEIALFGQWRRDPKKWIRHFFGENIRKEFIALTGEAPKTETGLTVQQEAACDAVGLLVTAKIKRHKKEKLTADETAVVDKIGVSIMSGQGAGKDFWAALMNWWFLACFKRPKNMATATSKQQLRNVFWSEMSKAARLSLPIDPKDPESPRILEHLYELHTEKIFLKKYEGKEHFLEGVTVSIRRSGDEQGEGLQGRHEKFMLITVDEGSDMPEATFMPLEGTLTGIVNIIILIFNPTRTRGYAINSQREKSNYIKLRWNTEDCEVVPKSRNQMIANSYGIDSNPYRIRVLGLPPIATSDTLIPPVWIEDAIDRYIEPDEFDPVISGLDVGAGGDKSVAIFRKGGKMIGIHRNNSPDTMEVVKWYAQLFNQYDATVGFVDLLGIGKGVYDRLRELRYRVMPVDAKASARSPERFINLRAEMYWTMREAFESGLISIIEDKDLVDTLSVIKYDDEKKIVIWKKSKIKKELENQNSPDEADALAISYAYPEAMFRKAAQDPYEDDEEENFKASEYAWMRA